jgi:hypothetical protein
MDALRPLDHVRLRQLVQALDRTIERLEPDPTPMRVAHVVGALVAYLAALAPQLHDTDPARVHALVAQMDGTLGTLVRAEVPADRTAAVLACVLLLNGAFSLVYDGAPKYPAASVGFIGAAPTAAVR